MTTRADKLLREAAQYLASAEQKQSRADADKWAAAERMWKANKEEGVSLREIAGAVGMGKDSVNHHVAVWELRLSTAVDSFTEAYYTVRESATPEAREDRAVERVLRERPHVVAEKIAEQPKAARAIAEHVPARLAVTRAVDEHDESRERRSAEQFAAAVGQETVDGLAAEQRLRDAEAKLFEARRALRDMLALLHDSDIENLRDSWREDFLKTLDDLVMRVDVARSLLGGTLDADLERFLAEV